MAAKSNSFVTTSLGLVSTPLRHQLCYMLKPSSQVLRLFW